MKKPAKSATPEAAPAPTQPPAPPAAPVTAASLDQKTLDLILASDVANIVKKVKAGKPLSASEREILKQRLNAAPAASAPGTPGPATPAGPAIPSIVPVPELARNKGGRPRFKIDYRLAASLAGIQCTVEEIASILECSSDTLARDARFCGLYKKKVDSGRMCLRRHQWKAVEEGNATMMIWLGKQYLKQTDRTELTGILKPEAGPDLTAARIAAMPTADLRRLLGPPTTDNIIDVVATPVPGNSRNGTNGHGSNGK
jgi:hypothetical protein